MDILINDTQWKSQMSKKIKYEKWKIERGEWELQGIMKKHCLQTLVSVVTISLAMKYFVNVLVCT